MVDDDKSLDRTHVHELGYRRARSLEVRSIPLTPEFLRSSRCDKLIIAIPSLSKERFLEISLAAQEAKVQVVFLPGEFFQDHYWTESINVDGLLLTSVGVASPGWYYSLAKRTLDLSLSILLLALLSPVIALICLLIVLDSPGPAFFVQKRVGKNGRLFNMFKFRSMRSDAPKYGISPEASEDPRITRMGKWLRKSSLDELPQLLNVVKGEMSLVGPRPEMPFIVERYDLRQRQRLYVTPGITGLWQLSADRAFHIHENIHYDLYYIRHRGFFFDLAILIHTAFFAARGI
jgi:lipopolysaccharide/colanic/teichoic acid biosynthesis glycosyltransferase